MPTFTGVNEFYIDPHGYALIIKLIEKRIIEDIKKVKDSLMKEEKTVSQLKKEEGFLSGLRRSFTEIQVDKLETQLHKKQLWLEKWLQHVWRLPENQKELQEKSIDELLQIYQNNSADPKLYLIVQEAVLAPVYAEFDGMPKRLSEIDTNYGVESISSACGFPEGTGKKILKNTEDFLKKASVFHGSMASFALEGMLPILATACLATPGIVNAIDGAKGSDDAIATNEEPDFSDGAIASKEFGFPGKPDILIGGGALLLASEKAGLAKFIDSHEFVNVSLAKILNYVTYLSKLSKNGHQEALRMKETIINGFLTFKYETEFEFLMQHHRKREHGLKMIKVMNYAYEYLTNIPS